MAKAHECPLAAVCTGVKCEERYPACRRQPTVEVSSLLVLLKVATAGNSVWLGYVLGSELGLLLRHGNPHCTFSSFAINCKQQRNFKTDRPSLLSHICHPEVNVVISRWSYVDKGYFHFIATSTVLWMNWSNLKVGRGQQRWEGTAKVGKGQQRWEGTAKVGRGQQRWEGTAKVGRGQQRWEGTAKVGRGQQRWEGTAKVGRGQQRWGRA